ncbi:MAG: sigma-70 family RNA polymerase sigma factor [Proteobacteria bacterium]|jgi:RNA polymerase sigma-70 factor (TIGR02943 family)|nr:sigma-70 family RNA polymerase sigma factor [Burkholderiaceae bacterium]MCH8857540.1 sigma-70 family RNA polymerase sigma factor [Pseudomonadota bacterium]|mmetsp:Transcript_53146/g.124441  ORF Transcript_53146/g.124441 Transcript_53146/m.124441 type:complete len:194 (-) Transcript_53146:392-973(-)
MNASSDYFRQIEALRPTLLKYARLQLRNPAWAEDAVSDTLLAALEKPQVFASQSQIKTWLIGILKHKLVDQIRKNCREVSTSATSEDGEDLEDLLFSSNGHWRETQLDWGNPEDALRQLDFMKVLEACVEKLPGQQGRLFMMREWLELDSDEICKELSITPTNLWVMLHRARLRLRECLQAGWFGQKAAGGVN